MNANFEYSKTLAGEGAILLLLSLVPTVGWVLGIVGVVLLLKSMREFSNYFEDESIYKNALTGLKYYVVAIVAAAVAIATVVLSIGVATAFTFNNFTPSILFGAGIAGTVIAGGVIAFVFYVLAASHLKRTFYTLAEKSGEGSLKTAGDLLWIGSILTIILVGLIVILVAWIFATIGFFSMKSRQYQQYTAQPNGYTPPSYTQPITPPAQTAINTRTVEGRGVTQSII
jgi:uncharacterized membrane protein